MVNKDVGYLRANVRTTNGAFPIKDALVVISEVKDGVSTILYQLYTDEGGNTATVSLPAPPRNLSEHPGSDLLPYALYNMRTSKEGYYSVENINLPIYSGITSVQTIDIVPIAAGDNANLYEKDTVEFNENVPPNL